MSALTLLYSSASLNLHCSCGIYGASAYRPGWFCYEEPPLCETLCSVLGVQRQQGRKNWLVRQAGESLNPGKAEQDDLKFEASLGYLVSSRLAWAI